MNFLCLAIIRIILEINFSRRVYTKLYISFRVPLLYDIFDVCICV